MSTNSCFQIIPLALEEVGSQLANPMIAPVHDAAQYLYLYLIEVELWLM